MCNLQPWVLERPAGVLRRGIGLPLAIDLIAVRLAALSPAELLERLDRRLVLPTDGPCDLPAHQQARRAAIAWSYQLLKPDHQALFRRLGVFVGGWTEEATAVVRADPGMAGGADKPRSPTRTSLMGG